MKTIIETAQFALDSKINNVAKYVDQIGYHVQTVNPMHCQVLFCVVMLCYKAHQVLATCWKEDHQLSLQVFQIL